MKTIILRIPTNACSDWEHELCVRKLKIIPIVAVIAREPFNTEGKSQFHRGRAAEDHRSVAAETDYPIDRLVRIGRRPKQGMNHADLPGEHPQSPLEINREPFGTAVVRQNEFVRRNK